MLADRIRRIRDEECRKLGCQPNSFGGHHQNCRSFTYTLDAAKAEEGTLGERASRYCDVCGPDPLTYRPCVGCGR